MFDRRQQRNGGTGRQVCSQISTSGDVVIVDIDAAHNDETPRQAIAYSTMAPRHVCMHYDWPLSTFQNHGKTHFVTRSSAVAEITARRFVSLPPTKEEVHVLPVFVCLSVC